MSKEGGLNLADHVVIVSRHGATIRWLQRKFGTKIPVLPHVGPEDVEGKLVIGNLPLHLASHAREVWEVVINIPPELRGKDLMEDEFLGLNPQLRRFVVREVKRTEKCGVCGREYDPLNVHFEDGTCQYCLEEELGPEWDQLPLKEPDQWSDAMIFMTRQK